MIAGVYGALVADTFREARVRWLFWILYGLSTLLILFFLFVLRIDVVSSAVSLLGAAPTQHRIGNMEHLVRSVYSRVALFLYIWGTGLAVFASTGLLSAIFEKGRIALLLSKPVSRAALLLGRFLGTFALVGGNVVYLVFSVWLVVGFKTQLWYPQVLLAIPIICFFFGVLLCFVALLSVIFESAAISVMATFALLVLTSLLAQREIAVRLLDSQWSRSVWNACYWVLPKTWDLGRVMMSFISDREADWAQPVVSSAIFGLAALALAVRLFQTRDY